MNKLLYSPNAKLDLKETKAYIAETLKNPVFIVRVLHGKRDFMKILFGKQDA